MNYFENLTLKMIFLHLQGKNKSGRAVCEVERFQVLTETGMKMAIF
jgi:hypothetical protein